MATTQIYTPGTVTVTAGSAVVTGVGTLWSGKVWPGCILLVGDRPAEVLRVDSNTQITLTDVWGGSTLSAANYWLLLTVWPTDVSDRVRLALESAQRVTVSASDPTSGSGIEYDIWIKTNGTSAVSFQSRGASSWSSPVSLIGAGMPTLAGSGDARKIVRANAAGNAFELIDPPRFTAQLTTGTNAPTSQTIIFNSVTTNIGSGYAAGTGIFTAPITGRYIFVATGLAVASGACELALYVRGSVGATSRHYATAYATQVETTSLQDMAAGDTAFVYVAQGSFYGVAFTRFSGTMIH